MLRMIIPGSTMYCDGNGGLIDVFAPPSLALHSVMCKNERVAEMPTIPLQEKKKCVKCNIVTTTTKCRLRNSSMRHGFLNYSKTPHANFITTSQLCKRLITTKYQVFTFYTLFMGCNWNLGVEQITNGKKPDWKMQISNRSVDYV
jgi:hypothetical protein